MSLPNVAPHPSSLAALADRAWSACAETTFNAGWTPLTRLSEMAAVSVLRKIQVGYLTVQTKSQLYQFPEENPLNTRPNLTGHLNVKNDAFWVRLCLMSDLGFSEAFMYGDVECNDLMTVFEIFMENQQYISQSSSKLSSLFSLLQKTTAYRFANSIGNSRANISAHYDISNDMFAGFLSDDMTYSCAIFPELDGDLKSSYSSEDQDAQRRAKLLVELPPSPPSSEPNEDILPLLEVPTAISDPPTTFDATIPNSDPLYLAQIRKLQHIIDKLHVPGPKQSGEPVCILEIGSGWGALAIRLAEQYPHVEIDTLTLSSAQQELAEERIAAQGSDISGRIRVHLMDYRNMPKEWAGRFSRFVSVEMIEAVGIEFMETYWSMVDWAMEDRNSVGVVQVITIPESRFEKYKNDIDFIRKWVFPGGVLPTLTYLISTLNTASKGQLVVDSVSNIGPHYARTLREWRRRFEAKFEAVVWPALQKEYISRTNGESGDLSRADAEVFRRKWIYYYCYCEIGFTTRTLGDHIITFAREGAQEYGCETFS
ncbi:cyclopropane-fatty-acyl-phospholipid synthase [Crepidotus variabilis]|uniref:Cyclopropane-fatty-acyl-phospholipid synthase n=1 Tax=Crepidotus variabilis TaxID=179855 RepID=A0A9P6E7H5_9AGAR|nr:cyclopropane-fatty-acyl-phospholipid synthase [Crepidotus variabilis]